MISDQYWIDRAQSDILWYQIGSIGRDLISQDIKSISNMISSISDRSTQSSVLLLMPGEELTGRGVGNNCPRRRNLTRVLRGEIPLWLQRGQPLLLLGVNLFGEGELLGDKLRGTAALNELRGLMSSGGRAREDSCPCSWGAARRSSYLRWSWSRAPPPPDPARGN